MKIPVEVCEYVIRKKFYRPMQVYIFLKVNCSGKIKKKELDYKIIAEALCLKSTRAVRNNLNILLKSNWMGYCKKSGYYYVRAFEKIRQMYGFYARTAAYFDGNEIHHMKAFIAAVKIAYLVNKQKRKKRATERVQGRSIHIARSSSQYYPLANEAMAKVLEISISTAYQLKLLASNAGYIHIKKTFEEINCGAGEANLFKRGLPELADKVITNTGKIRLQGIDMVMHFIKFSKRKKLETYKEG